MLALCHVFRGKHLVVIREALEKVPTYPFE